MREGHRFDAGTMRSGRTVALNCPAGMLRTAEGPVVLAAEADRTQIRADDTDLAYVRGELRDATGTVPTDGDQLVTVTVDGPAVLATSGPDDLGPRWRSAPPPAPSMTGGPWP